VREGENAAILEIPDLDRMLKRLENRGIFPLDRPLEKNPTEPVHSPSEFIGRERLLDSIKSNTHHYLISGGPKVGKTSLLKVLNDILIDNSNCCYVDMGPLLEHSVSFDQFEDSFISDCLSQHALRKKDLNLSSNTYYHILRAAIAAICGSKPFCVFCLDNFYIPVGKSKDWVEKLQTFLTDLYIQPNSRLVMAASQKNGAEIEKKFQRAGATRLMILIPLPIFDEREARQAIRKARDLNPVQVEDISRYCGNFPHLLALYKNWEKCGKHIAEYSQELVEREYEFIFDFFREIGHDTRLFLATLFYKDLISREIVFNHFYNDIPLFGQLIPKSILKKTIMAEINGCCDEIGRAHV
jgi:DNA polymerase III delta prime subunit